MVSSPTRQYEDTGAVISSFGIDKSEIGRVINPRLQRQEAAITLMYGTASVLAKEPSMSLIYRCFEDGKIYLSCLLYGSEASQEQSLVPKTGAMFFCSNC